MIDQIVRPDGTGFYLAGGELTVAGVAEQTIVDDALAEFSVTASLFGSADMDVTLASWDKVQTDDLGGVRLEDGRTVLPLRTQLVMLNSLPSSVRVQLRIAEALHDTEGAWRLILHFRNHTGSSLTWQASLPAEAFGAGWLAPLADLMTIDGADHTVIDPVPAPPQPPTGAHGMGKPSGAAASRRAGWVVGAHAASSMPASPAVTVIHHSDDEYYELLVDGQQAGLLVYHLIGSQLSITHTVIEQTYRGRGLSWVLIGCALDDIRTRFTTLSNYCPVVRRFAEKNPEYGDLLSPPRPA